MQKLNVEKQSFSDKPHQSFSDAIRECRDGVIRNPYQGTDKKVVFVCSMGILRSATAARLYANKYNTRAAGTWPDALIPLSDTLIAWADELVFVNKNNYEQVKRYFADNGTDLHQMANVKVLDIPDSYPHMALELVQAFNDQYEELDELLFTPNTKTA